MVDAATLVVVLEAQSKKLQNSLVDVNRQIDRFAAATERRFDSMQKHSDKSFAKLASSFRGSVGGLQNAIAPLIGALGVKEIIEYSDAWLNASNKLAAAGSVAHLQARSLDELTESAKRTRTSLEEYVDLYARLLRASTTVKASEEDVAKVTDIVAKSLKAGGASAQEQAASLIQLGQALSSGFLQGDELRSLRENAPLLAAAIAKAFGVTIGELKQLGADGKLSSEKVFKAILNGGAEIEAAFKKTRSTIGDAFTNINTAFTQYIGTAGQASGATTALVDALNFLANNFKEVGDVVLTFVAIIAGALIGKAVVGIVIGLGEAVVALGAFLTALSTGTLTVSVFTAALGPIALIASAAAVGIGYLIYAQGEAARAAKAHTDALTANATAIDTAKDSSKEFRDSLRRQIDLQIEAAKSALVNAEAQLKQAEATGDFLKLGALVTGHLFGESDSSRQQAGDSAYAGAVAGKIKEITDAKVFIADLEKQLKALDALGTGEPGSGGGGGSGSGKDDPYDKKLKSVRNATAAIIAQTEAQRGLNPLINDYAYAVDFAKTKQELLVAAQEAGIKLTPEIVASINATAAASAQASAEAAKLTEAQDESRQKMEDYFASAKDATKGFIDDLIAGKSAAEALGNVFQKLGDKLIDLGLNTLFGTGQGSNPFGLLGQLFFHADGGVAAHGRPQPLKTFARGGTSNSAAIFGEAGPEAAVPLPDGRRIPVDLRMPSASNDSGPRIVYAPVIDARGADQAAVDRLERIIQRQSAEFDSKVVGAVRQARKHRHL